MKKYHFIVLGFFLCSNFLIIKGQQTQQNLDQIELMKKWEGIWKCDVSKDTTKIWDLHPFGKGYELDYKWYANDKLYFQIKDFWVFERYGCD